MIISNIWSSGWGGGAQSCCFYYWASLTMTFSCFMILDLGCMLGFDNLWGSWGVWVENMFLYMDFLMLLPGALELSQHLGTPSSFCWLARPSELCKLKPKCVEFSGESFSSPVRAMANTNNCPCSLSLLEVDFFFFFSEPITDWSALRASTLCGESQLRYPSNFLRPKVLLPDPQIAPCSRFRNTSRAAPTVALTYHSVFSILGPWRFHVMSSWFSYGYTLEWMCLYFILHLGDF